MRNEIVWSVPVLDQAAGFLRDDASDVAAVMEIEPDAATVTIVHVGRLG